MSTLAYNDAAVGMKQIQCAKCSMVFWPPKHFVEARQNDHETFYCPAGHTNFYPGKSNEEKLRDELTREKHRTEQAEADASYVRNRLTVLERQRAAARGQVTKIKNRVAKGVCPCCNRTFENLARHMAGKHPDFAPPVSE